MLAAMTLSGPGAAAAAPSTAKDGGTPAGSKGGSAPEDRILISEVSSLRLMRVAPLTCVGVVGGPVCWYTL